MTQYTFPDIRRRPDGSIDTAHYIAKGRAERSQAAHDILRKLHRPEPAPRPRRPWVFGALLPIR